MSTEQDRIRAEAESKKAKMIAEAKPATADTEEALRRLELMVWARREDPVLKAQYEELRDALAAQLGAEGPRYFINPEGVKQYAYNVAPEGIEVDVAKIIEMHEAGEITDAVLEEVAPRQVDKEGLRHAIARGANPRARKPGISPAQVTKVARIVPRTAYVGFADAEEQG